MRERRSIVELWQRGDAAALATLVRVEGSSYRRPGARLLIAASGDHAGAISGGCLEAEIIRKAQWKIRHGAAMERYSTLFDDTADMPYGLGCGGTVEVLIEPAGTPEFQSLMQAMQASLRGERIHITTQLPKHGNTFARYIFNPCGDQIFRSARALLNPADPFFDEWLEPPQRLVLFGAGDDARPLVRLASLLGWRTVVIDSRAQWVRTDRFPEAELVTTSLEDLSLQAEDAVVLMTHSYEQDRAWLTSVLPSGPRYLGLLGARHRSALLLSEAAALLGWTVADVCKSVFAPVGLDLGGDGAESIALAIISEIHSFIEGKLATTRHMTAEMIEQQIAQGGTSRYLQTQCAQ